MGKTVITAITSRSLLTPASGFITAYKFTLNPYSGCAFACDYCYARFFAPTYEEQEHWGQWVKVKENALHLLRRALRSRSPARRIEPGDAIYLSSVTDPYQPVERRLGLTRAILELLAEVQPRLTIQTRSPLVARDVDLFKRFEHIRINMTITTDSDAVRKRYEPRCPSIEQRLRAAEEVAAAGIPIGISISPMLPVADPASFGRRLAALNAAEYVAQYVHVTRSRFVAGTGPEAVRKLREDGWSEERYAEVRAVIQQQLDRRPLLEGNDGFAPPP